MRLCKDCKHYSKDDVDTGLALADCHHPKATNTDPVEGYTTHATCKEMRKANAACGLDASLFEPLNSSVHTGHVNI